MLDPRISYEGIGDDYRDDPDLLRYLDKSMAALREYYILNYASARSTGVMRAATERHERPHASSSTGDLSPSKVSFTSRYQKKDGSDRDELAEYFKLPREDWDSCNPLQWWVGRRAQFPKLFCLARDLLGIPGESYFILGCTVLTTLCNRVCSCGGADLLGGSRYNFAASCKPTTRDDPCSNVSQAEG